MQVVSAFAAALTPRTRLVIVDHITAQTALVMPVAEIAAVCRARGIPVLVDGAHAPGSLAVDISALGVDYYSANLHKWAHAPRACGILWARAGSTGASASSDRLVGLGQGIPARVRDGTRPLDPTTYLSAPDGIALLQEWGFEAVLDYMHGLAWEAAGLLTSRWGTTLDTPRDMVGAMVTVPLPERAGATDDDARQLRLSLLVDDRIEVPVARVARPPLDAHLRAGLQRPVGRRTARRRCRPPPVSNAPRSAKALAERDGFSRAISLR